MTARYIVRLDDACPTMDNRKWGLVEAVLDEFGICPLVAVVPDNRDPELQCNEPDLDFWDKVRGWRAKGWTIAMHGYQHKMHSTNAKMLLPFYKRSEFAGLNYDEQVRKIGAAWQLFLKQGITPNVWIAPAHCFDTTTLKAIYAQTSIRIVSDGIARDQYFAENFFWIPQQLWSFKARSSGLWTVCLHPNTMTENDIELFRRNLAGLFNSKVISISDIHLKYRTKSLRDLFVSVVFWRWLRLSRLIERCRKYLHV